MVQNTSASRDTLSQNIQTWFFTLNLKSPWTSMLAAANHQTPTSSRTMLPTSKPASSPSEQMTWSSYKRTDSLSQSTLPQLMNTQTCFSITTSKFLLKIVHTPPMLPGRKNITKDPKGLVITGLRRITRDQMSAITTKRKDMNPRNLPLLSWSDLNKYKFNF